VFFCLETATGGRLCTLPALSRGRDKKDAPRYVIALPASAFALRVMADESGER
jgi:hypothetical protein